jgi:hypothetical protein
VYAVCGKTKARWIMSIRKTDAPYVVECNHCAWLLRLEDDVLGVFDTERDARIEAQVQGWEVRGTFAKCPKCVKAHEQEEAEERAAQP